jgi:hypothetical protein
MNDEETTQQMFDRLMVLVNNIRALGSGDWDDYKVTKKLLAAYSPKNFNIAAMIRRDKSFKKMSPILLLSELIQHENAEKDMLARLNKKGKKGIALKAKEEVETKHKASKSKKQESSKEEDDEEESMDEETALLMRNFKRFMKTKNFKKTFGTKGRPKRRPCYKCGEYGHFIAECPNKDNNNKDEEKKDKYKPLPYLSLPSLPVSLPPRFLSSLPHAQPERRRLGEQLRPSSGGKASGCGAVSASTEAARRVAAAERRWRGERAARWEWLWRRVKQGERRRHVGS